MFGSVAVAAAFLIAACVYPQCDLEKDGCTWEAVEGEFGKFLDNYCGSDKSKRECVAQGMKNGDGEKFKLMIDVWVSDILKENKKYWDKIAWPLPPPRKANATGKATAAKYTQRENVLNHEIPIAKENIRKKESEIIARKNDYNIACEELMKEAEKLKNPDYNYSISTFSSGKITKSFFDLRNVNNKNFRGMNPDRSEKLKNNEMGDDKNLYKSVMKNRQVSFSRTFKLNKDFLINDTLSLYKDMEINEGSQVIGMSSGLITQPLIQPLILNEFQPYDMISPGDLLPGVAGDIAAVVGKASNLMGGNALIELGKNAMMRKKIDDFSNDPSKLYSLGAKTRERNYFSSVPIQVVQNIFNGGKWLNTYELPFYGKNYLETNFADKWNKKGSEGFLGAIAGNSDAKKGELSTKGFGIDFPSNPKFSVDMKNCSRERIKTEFYLVNVNTQWLIKNFEFIQAFYAGSEWLHLPFCQVRPPNIYHVLCPGRFQIYWAALDITITFEGKLRKNIEASNKISSLGIKSIDEDMLWPEAWKVAIDIRDFTPNNFNLYAEYYEHGFKAEEVATLEKEITLVEALTQAFKYLEELTKEMKQYGSETLNEAKREGGKLVEQMTNLGNLKDGKKKN